MFSYKANAICMAGMTMPAGAGVAASHYWNRVPKPRQLINYAPFWPHRWTFAKNRTAHAQTHYQKSTQWQWASFISDVCPLVISGLLMTCTMNHTHKTYKFTIIESLILREMKSAKMVIWECIGGSSLVHMNNEL